MAFTVAIGSVSGGVAIIPCDNTTRTPCSLLPHHTSFPRTRRNSHVVWAKKFSPESPRGSVTTADEAQQRTVEMEDPVDDAVYSYEWLGLPGPEPDFWEGPQWDWLGTFVKYSWIIGFPVAVILSLYGCATYRVVPKDLKQAAAMNGSESVQSSELFEESETYDLDVFDSNPTEVAPSLE